MENFLSFQARLSAHVKFLNQSIQSRSTHSVKYWIRFVSLYDTNLLTVHLRHICDCSCLDANDGLIKVKWMLHVSKNINVRLVFKMAAVRRAEIFKYL